MAQTVMPAKADVGAGTTDSVLVAGVPGRTIRVLQFQFVAGATATNTTFNTKGSGAGVAISPVYQNGANGGAVANYSPVGWLFTNAGEALTVTTGAGSQVGVLVGYDLI